MAGYHTIKPTWFLRFSIDITCFSFQIYVSNHTSIIDYMVLCTIAPFGTVGQKHPGVLGFLQEKVIACMDNIWFDRSVQQQKNQVSARIKEHISDPSKARLLIFPEGIITITIILF